jgi:hypothetical protein
MGSSITFYRKGEQEPTPLQKIDDEICEKVGERVDNRWFWRSWMDYVAMPLAYGCDMKKVRERLNRDRQYELLHMCDLLEEHYTWRIG